ncbi:C3a anaphylatoxin chemotactic receptor-like [Leptodactylus fuscus]|uniref:C3a anaphylatoxin chemotactic receptor-like n=1 Tax=Leptodactylus fuscus TaxID=238119 RepID=UPI003F4EDDC5
MVSIWQDPPDIHYKPVLITLCSIIFPLGIIGNGLVIWIAGFRIKKTISAVWFLHLAIADFLCCVSMPLQIAVWARISEAAGMPICILTTKLITMNMFASVLLLTAMSIDRCVSVMWPFWAEVYRTRRLVRITAGGIWVFSFILTCLMVYIEGLYMGSITMWCMLYRNYYSSINLNRQVHLARLVIMFVIPFLIILTSYLIIFNKIRKSNRRQRSQRPYRIITAVILCFFICSSPYYILPIILTVLKGIYVNVIHPVYAIITILAYLNSCLNPIIYVFMGQNIKPYFFRSIPARIERALSDYPEEPNREPEEGENICNTDV